MIITEKPDIITMKGYSIQIKRVPQDLYKESKSFTVYSEEEDIDTIFSRIKLLFETLAKSTNDKVKIIHYKGGQTWKNQNEDN